MTHMPDTNENEVDWVIRKIRENKEPTPEQIAIDNFGEEKRNNAFFSIISDETYIGYVTAMLLRDYANLGLTVKEWYDIVKNLVQKGKL